QEELRNEMARREEEQRKERARQEEERRQQEARRAEEEARRKERERQERLTRLAKPLAKVTIPDAEAGSETLAATRKEEDGLTWAILPLGTDAAGQPQPRPNPIQAPRVAGACWAADGRSFFALTSAGVLRRVSYPDLKEMRKVDFKQDCDDLGSCKFGLLVTLRQLQEIWIVNPDTLAVVRRFG